MTMSITGIGAGRQDIGSTASGGVSKPATAFDAILEALKKVGKQTPMERAREAVLKKHNLSEDQYSALQANERASIDTEIRDAVRKVAEAQMKPKRPDGQYA